MAGSLIKINQAVASNSSSLSVTGMTDTYSTYCLIGRSYHPSSSDQLEIRVTKSGIAQSDAEYDWTYQSLYGSASQIIESADNQTHYLQYNAQEENGEDALGNQILIWCYNFRSTQPSICTVESTWEQYQGTLFTSAGGFVHTVNSVSDGLNFTFGGSTNITVGTFTLYGLKK